MIVKSGEETQITIPSNSQKTGPGYVDVQIRYQDFFAMPQALDDAHIPKNIDIVLTINNYKYGRKDAIPITICNISTCIVIISPQKVCANYKQ